MKEFFRKLFRRPPKGPIAMDLVVPIEQFEDFLDPHGDGSIRPGDPAWEMFAHVMKTGKGVIGSVDEQGNLTYSDFPDEPKV